MWTDRPRNRPLVTAALGGGVAVLAAAVLAVTLPSRGLPSTGDTAAESHGPSVSVGQSSLPQHALHRAPATTAVVALRLADPGGHPPASARPTAAGRPGGRADAPAVTRTVPSRLPCRVLHCTWLI
jgi:hypothetical protein